jgi:hypothetical protein
MSAVDSTAVYSTAVWSGVQRAYITTYGSTRGYVYRQAWRYRSAAMSRLLCIEKA